MDIGGLGRSSLTQPLLSDTSVSEDMGLGDGVLDQDRIGDLQMRGRQVIGQAPLSSLGPSVSTQTTALERALDQWEATAPPGKNMPKHVGVSMPPGGHTVRLDGAMVESEIASLPESERSEAVRGMPQVLQERVNHGHELYTGIMSGENTGPASLEDVRDLMTFLTAKGMEKSDGFSEGAFSIQDPGHQLRDFLDSCTEVYQRPSSHISKFTDAPGGTHRGIDVDGDVKLPFGKATVLYGAMNDGVEGMRGDRLFIKMESHGCRLSSGSLGSKRDADGPSDRPMRFGRDLKQTLGHACGFFKTLMRKVSGGRLFANSPDSRKERIPSDVKKEFKALVKQFKDSGDDTTKGILELDKPTSDSRGIRTMVDNLRSALGNEALVGEGRDAVEQMLDKLLTRYDHVDVRVGDEMILDMDELGVTNTAKGVEGQLRASINSLLSVDGPDDLTDAQVEKFGDQLSKMALLLEHAGGADDANRAIDEAMLRATANLSDSQKTQLSSLLTSDKCKGVMEGMLDVVSMGGENLRGLSGDAKATGARVARMVTDAFIGLCKATSGGQEPDLGVASRENLGKAIGLLKRVGIDSSVTLGTDTKLDKQAFSKELSENRAGLGLLSAKRGRLPDGVMVLGDHAKGLVRGEVDKEAIGQRLVDSLTRDLGLPEGDFMAGLPRSFVMDFLREGVDVDGVHFGGGGDNQPQETKLEKLESFIDAVGGLDKAKQVATLAHQGLVATMLTSFLPDEGLGDVAQGHATYTGETLSTSRTMSISTAGDSLGVQMEYSEQRVNSSRDEHESGMNLSLGFTIQGAGSEDPVVRLDGWDALYGTCDQSETRLGGEQVGKMDLGQMRTELGRDKFALGSYASSMMRQLPVRGAIKDGLETKLGDELTKTVSTGYRGLSRDFVVDFFRRPITVDGVQYGGTGGVDSRSEDEVQEMLDAFVDAVGGEREAQLVARVAFQNVPGIMDTVISADPGLAEVTVGYMMHPAPVDDGGTRSEFSITTNGDGTFDIHYGFSEQKTEARGHEMGKLASLDYTLGGTGLGETPTLELKGWDVLYGSNPPRG